MFTRVSGSFTFSYFAVVVAVLLVVAQPGTRAVFLTNVARIFEIHAIERPARTLKLDANRATALIVSQHLEREVFASSAQQSLARALRFARLSEAALPDSRNAFGVARLNALLGDHTRALEELDRRPPPDLAGQWAVLVATLNERMGTRDGRDDWSIEGDTSASYFLDLARYLSERGDLPAADRSLLLAVRYAHSPGAVYVANYRMALHKMYGLNQAEASLPYFSHADSLRTLVPPALEDAFGFHFSYAHALLNAHRFPDAVAHASRAVTLNSQDPHAQEVLGRAHLDTGNLAQARRAYTSSIKLYEASHLPVPGYTYFGLGQTEFALGDRVRAREMFARALEGDVHDEMRTYITGFLAGLDNSHGR